MLLGRSFGSFGVPFVTSSSWGFVRLCPEDSYASFASSPVGALLPCGGQRAIFIFHRLWTAARLVPCSRHQFPLLTSPVFLHREPCSLAGSFGPFGVPSVTSSSSWRFVRLFGVFPSWRPPPTRWSVRHLHLPQALDGGTTGASFSAPVSVIDVPCVSSPRAMLLGRLLRFPRSPIHDFFVLRICTPLSRRPQLAPSSHVVVSAPSSSSTGFGRRQDWCLVLGTSFHY